MKSELKILAVVVLLFLQPKIIFGQLNISGHIIEETTKNPVQFANIWIKDANIGTTSDEFGFFTIITDSLFIGKSIVISAIGYSDTIIPVGKIQSEIGLKQKVYQLSEIAVYPKKRKVLIINDLSDIKLDAAIMNDTTPQIVGRYFGYDERNLSFRYVKSVTIYSRDTHKGKFNLRLYSFDTISLRPIKELVNQNIIVETRSSLFGEPKPVEIDLSEYKIIFPGEGLLVCVEWLILPENRYNITFSNSDSKKKKVKIMYAPNLGATLDKDGYMFQYTKGFWWKPIRSKRPPAYNGADCYFNPAISLTLTD
jgi:hypothetical protein